MKKVLFVAATLCALTSFSAAYAEAPQGDRDNHQNDRRDDRQDKRADDNRQNDEGRQEKRAN